MERLDEIEKELNDIDLSAKISDEKSSQIQKTSILVQPNPTTDFSFTKPDFFIFGGKKYYVKNWIDVACKICVILHEIDKDKFEIFLKDEGEKKNRKPYVSKNEELLVRPKKIDSIEIYIETKLDTKRIVDLILDLQDRYKVSQDDMFIHINKKNAGRKTKITTSGGNDAVKSL